MTRVELKNAAKEQISGKIGRLFLINLVVVSIVSACSFVPIIGGIGALILDSVFTISVGMIYLKNARKEDFKIDDIFKGFDNTGKLVLLNVLTSIYTFLWTLLFIIPGIIKTISYGMAPLILAEDNTLTATDAIEKSKTMMEGHKMDYFILLLSFIGWILLFTVTLGIAGIYVIPYMQATIVNFYNSIKD